VNADQIAADRFPGRELEESYEVAWIATAAWQALIEARLDFCTETVFSHDSRVDLVTSAAGAGSDVASQHAWRAADTMCLSTSYAPATNASGPTS